MREVRFLRKTYFSHYALNLVACSLSTTQRFTSCRELRQIRSTSCGLLRGELPKRDDHLLSACADGNHACCFSCGCEVGMFFSLSYIIFLLIKGCGFSGCKVRNNFLPCKIFAVFFKVNYLKSMGERLSNNSCTLYSVSCTLSYCPEKRFTCSAMSSASSK